MVSLYLMTTIISLLIKIFNIYPLASIQIHFLPAISYCFFVTLTIFPFYYYNLNTVKIIRLNNSWLFYLLIYIYFFSLSTTLILNFKNIVDIVSGGDIYNLRMQIYKYGSIDGLITASGFARYVLMPFNIISLSSSVMLLFYFYSICFLDNSRLFNLFIFSSSLGAIFQGILFVDRSAAFYYILFLFLAILMFRPYFRKEHRQEFRLPVALLFIVIMTYGVIVTAARFGQQADPGIDSAINYLGQPLLHYSLLWENHEIPERSLQYIFPLLSKYLLNTSVGREWIYYIDSLTGNKGDVFYSVVGMLIRDVGKVYATMLTFLFLFVTMMILKNLRRTQITFEKLLLFFLVAVIPQAGIISYYYNKPYKSMSLVFLVLVAFIFKINFKEEKTRHNAKAVY